MNHPICDCPRPTTGASVCVHVRERLAELGGIGIPTDGDALSYRAWALGIVGDTPAARAASDEDLRGAVAARLQRYEHRIEVRELLEAASAYKRANEAWSAAFAAAAQRVGDSYLLTRLGSLDELAPEAVPLVEESNRCMFRLTKAAKDLPT